jgi:hypothetical protein
MFAYEARSDCALVPGRIYFAHTDLMCKSAILCVTSARSSRREVSSMSDTPLSRDAGSEEPFDLERAPLDDSDLSGADWGGDGSDRLRPVRAHVLAALTPSSGPYAPPLDALLTTDEGSDVELLREELGIGQEHVPELIRMTRDRALNTAPGDSPQVWAPIYALEMLSELDPGAGVVDLVPLFDVDSEYFGEDLPQVIGRAGAAALAPVSTYLEDRTRWVWGHSRAADALKEVAGQHPELRGEVVGLLSGLLENAEHYHPLAASGVLSALLDLKAAEALPVIRRAHERGSIDETVNGPWGEVLAELGLEPEPGDPLVAESRQRFDERHELMFGGMGHVSAATPRATRPASSGSARRSDEKRKQKQKRKAASNARKANRKKKRK